MVWQVDSGSTFSIQGSRVNSSGQVLDLNGITVATATTFLGSARVAYDGSNFLVVWEDTRSGLTKDIYARQVSPTGNVLGQKDIAVSTATHNQQQPAVVCQSGTCLVVWEDGRFSSGGIFEGGIYGARVDLVGNILDSTGIAIAKSQGTKEMPDVTGDGTKFMVVWKDDSSGNGDIYGARLGAKGTLLDTTGILLSSHTGIDDQPRVAFDGKNYFVVWSAMVTVNQWDIRGARVSTGGTVLDVSDIAIASSTYAEISPAITLWGSGMMVTWDHQESGHKLYGTNVTALGKAQTLSGVEFQAKGADLYHPAVASDGARILMVWSDYNPSYPKSQIYGSRLGQ